MLSRNPPIFPLNNLHPPTRAADVRPFMCRFSRAALCAARAFSVARLCLRPRRVLHFHKESQNEERRNSSFASACSAPFFLFLAKRISSAFHGGVQPCSFCLPRLELLVDHMGWQGVAKRVDVGWGGGVIADIPPLRLFLREGLRFFACWPLDVPLCLKFHTVFMCPAEIAESTIFINL